MTYHAIPPSLCESLNSLVIKNPKFFHALKSYISLHPEDPITSNGLSAFGEIYIDGFDYSPQDCGTVLRRAGVGPVKRARPKLHVSNGFAPEQENYIRVWNREKVHALCAYVWGNRLLVDEGMVDPSTLGEPTPIEPYQRADSVLNNKHPNSSNTLSSIDDIIIHNHNPSNPRFPASWLGYDGMNMNLYTAPIDDRTKDWINDFYFTHNNGQYIALLHLRDKLLSGLTDYKAETGCLIIPNPTKNVRFDNHGYAIMTESLMHQLTNGDDRFILDTPVDDFGDINILNYHSLPAKVLHRIVAMATYHYINWENIADVPRSNQEVWEVHHTCYIPNCINPTHLMPMQRIDHRRLHKHLNQMNHPTVSHSEYE